MRTTIEMPDELLSDAKAYATATGVSLRQFFIDAVQSKLSPPRAKFRTEPPVIGRAGDTPVPFLTGEQIDEIMFAGH